MLRSGTDEPNRTFLALGQDSTSGVNVDLRLAVILEIVVRGPDPSSLQVRGGLARDVQSEECSSARLDGVVGELQAVGHGDVATGESTNADMYVPHGGGSLLAGLVGGIPFDDDGTKNQKRLCFEPP